TVAATQAHTDERTAESKCDPDPPVQAAGRYTTDHGTDIAAEGKSGAVAQEEAGQQADGPLAPRHAGGRRRLASGEPECSSQNSQVRDGGHIHEYSLAQRIEIARLAPECVGGGVENPGSRGELGAPQAKAIDHTPWLAGQQQI